MQVTGASLEQRLLRDTLGAFGEGSATVLSPEQGLLLPEGWLNALAGDVGTERITAETVQLRDHLKTGQPNAEHIRHLMLSMASHTSVIAHEPGVGTKTATQLGQLGSVLRNFSSQL